MNTVNFKLACEKKPGILSRLIGDVKQFGLKYQKHRIQEQDDFCIIHLSTSGQPNVSPLQIRQKLEDSGQFKAILDISMDPAKQSSQAVESSSSSQGRRKTSRHPIRPQDHLSPSVLTTAEKRLSRYVGPVALHLVDDAAIHSANVGELFEILALQIHSDLERQEFLSILQS